MFNASLGAVECMGRDIQDTSPHKMSLHNTNQTSNQGCCYYYQGSIKVNSETQGAARGCMVESIHSRRRYIIKTHLVFLKGTSQGGEDAALGRGAPYFSIAVSIHYLTLVWYYPTSQKAT